MTDSMRPKRDVHALVASVILVLTTWASGIAAFVTVKERVESLTQQTAESRADDQRRDERLRAIETSRALEQQISTLTAEIAALKAEQRALREELARRRR